MGKETEVSVTRMLMLLHATALLLTSAKTFNYTVTKCSGVTYEIELSKQLPEGSQLFSGHLRAIGVTSVTGSSEAKFRFHTNHRGNDQFFLSYLERAMTETLRDIYENQKLVVFQYESPPPCKQAQRGS